MKGRENTMGLFTKEQMNQFIGENNFKTAGDIQTALKEMFAETMQSFIEAEFDTHMGYVKHDIKNKKTANSRNGNMPPKTVKTDIDSIELHVPSDRNGEYEPQIVKKHQTDLSGMEQQIYPCILRECLHEISRRTTISCMV